jgi:hypothetical protein
MKNTELQKLVKKLENSIAWKEKDIEELKQENSFLKNRTFWQWLKDEQYGA